MMEQLKARRKQLGLTQADMGRIMGVRTNTYARWERCDLQPHEGLVRVTTLLLEMVGSRTARRLLP